MINRLGAVSSYESSNDSNQSVATWQKICCWREVSSNIGEHKNKQKLHKGERVLEWLLYIFKLAAANDFRRVFEETPRSK